MLPPDFLERFQTLCPRDRLDTALDSFAQPKNVSFRVNRLKTQPETALQALESAQISFEPVQWTQDYAAAYITPSSLREKLTHTRGASNGEIYIQSLSSMVAPILLNPTASDWVLDLAAAPGGKTILLAEMMGNAGKISAVEPIKSRFFRMNANLGRTGVTNTTSYLKDGRAVGSLKPNAFDKVMLDAPCSSESRFRTNDENSFKHWNLRKVAECAKKQKRLILSGFDALKPGGTMVYCTCSYAPEENELIVAHLLKKRLNAKVLPVNIPLNCSAPGMTHWGNKTLPDACANSIRIWPNADMDGFFLTLITKHN